MRIYMGAPTRQAYKEGKSSDLKRAKKARLTRPLRLLLSYHYYKDEDLEELLHECFEGIEVDVFADSGAYSASTVGEAIDPVLYTKWVQRWEGVLSVAAGPDVIGNPEVSYKATKEMLKHVKRIPVLPTYHVGESWGWLDRCAELSDYVAFGGMVPHARNPRLLVAWCRRAFDKLRGKRVHGFGVTSWRLLRSFPWYSVDSSSWTAGFRYAQLLLFDEKCGKMVEVQMADSRSLLANAGLLSRYGMRPSEVRSQGYDRDKVCGVCIESWQRAEAWLEANRSPTKKYFVLGSASESSNCLPQELRRGVRMFASLGAYSGQVQSLGRGTRMYLSCGAHPGGENAKAGTGDVRSVAKGVSKRRRKRDVSG